MIVYIINLIVVIGYKLILKPFPSKLFKEDFLVSKILVSLSDDLLSMVLPCSLLGL